MPSRGPSLKRRRRAAEASDGAFAGPFDLPTPTDSQGKFLFENIAAGTYTLRAEHPGFIVQYYSTATQKPIARMSLDPGQEVKDVALKLTPQGIIFGKVVDDDGEPLPGAAVQALHWGFVNGKRQLQSRGGTTVQADGSFILGNLPEGRYYLSAEARAVYYVRIPGQGEKDSGVNAKTIPGRWRTGFRADREQ
jgi:hypothetical protein